jgi:hypothetical protein
MPEYGGPTRPGTPNVEELAKNDAHLPSACGLTANIQLLLNRE